VKELPNSWVVCKLGEVLFIQNGYAFSSKDFKDKGVPLIRQSNLAGKCISLDKCVYLDPVFLETKKDFVLKKNDVLIGMSGSIGKLCIYNLDQPALQNQRTGKINLLSKDIVDWRFIWEYLKTIESELKGKSKGLGVNNVSSADIESLQFFIPPLNEQRRIVAKLEKLLAKVDACKERLEKIPAILKRFRQSVLAAATNGYLTESWQEEKTSKKDSRTATLEEVAIEFSYGSSSKSSAEGSVPVLRMGNIRDGKLDWSDLVFTSNSKEIEKYLLAPGDVLFNRTNSPELVGKTAVYNGERAAIYAGYLIRIRCSEKILPDYLNYCLNSPSGRQYCSLVKSDGVSQSNINARKLSMFELYLPSLDEQHEIVRRVEALFKIADDIEKRYQKAKAHVDKLTQSILAKAFRGELVPQDPNDEPASELLKRIQEERKNQKAEARPNRKSTSRRVKN